MGTTKVNICNSALAKVGATRISSLDDDKKQARLCKELYTIITQQMIESHPWNFAVARVQIAATVSKPAFGFAYQFQVPSDCLRVLNVDSEFPDEGGSFYNWKREADKILTNDSTCKIKYIKDVSERPDLFSSNFSEALSYRIAADLAYPLAQSDQLANRLNGQYAVYLAFARSYDAQEGSSDRFSADEWLDSRY